MSAERSHAWQCSEPLQLLLQRHLSSSKPLRCLIALFSERPVNPLLRHPSTDVNLKLVQQLAGSEFELDTITLHHQPQGAYSLRTHAELWDVRHVHSRFFPAVAAFGVPSDGGGYVPLRPYGLVLSADDDASTTPKPCSLWRGWRWCFACEGSFSQRACLTPARDGGRAWFSDGRRGLLAPTSLSECGGLPPSEQTTDVCKGARLASLLAWSTWSTS